MSRASYPGASERELFRSAPSVQPTKKGSVTELVLLAAVLIFTATQLIW